MSEKKMPTKRPAEPRPSTSRARSRSCSPTSSRSPSPSLLSSSGAKKKKTGVTPKRVARFRREWQKEYPCIQPPRDGKVGSAWCAVCQKSIEVAHGGKNDISRHVSTKLHKKEAAARDSAGRLSLFGFTSAKELTKTEQQTIKAEVLFAHFLVEHNVAIMASDHAGKLFQAMFPGSEVVEKYASSRTKTTSILKVCSSSHQKELAALMQIRPFIIGTDGSQDGAEKFYPIVVRVLDNMTIRTELLANPTCDEASTGENIFSLLDTCLDKFKIPWANCMALVCDNANVMTGANRGVISYVKRKNPNLHLAGCVCHLFHLTAKKALKASSKFDMDELPREVHWYFSKSTNRQLRFKALQIQCGVPQHAILEHVPTRWLTMGKAMNRLLEQWEPLHLFFTEERNKEEEKGGEASNAMVCQLHDIFKKRTPRLYVAFYAAVLKLFEDVNAHLQSDSARLHTVKRDIDQLYRRLCCSILKPAALNQGHPMEASMQKANLKEPEHRFIGEAADARLKAGLHKEEKKEFFERVAVFYKTAIQYMRDNLDPRHQSVWNHAEVADPQKIKSKNFTSVAHFIRRFPCLLPEGVTIDQVEMEFHDFVCDGDLPPANCDQLEVEECWQ